MLMETVLVPVDFSSGSQRAVEFASHLASGPNATLILLHVVDSAFTAAVAQSGFAESDEASARLRAQAEGQLAQMRAHLAAFKGRVDYLVCVGVPFLEIIAKAHELEVDLIVMGTRGFAGRPGAERLFFGSTAEKVLRGAQYPVLTVPEATTVNP